MASHGQNPTRRNQCPTLFPEPAVSLSIWLLWLASVPEHTYKQAHVDAEWNR